MAPVRGVAVCLRQAEPCLCWLQSDGLGTGSSETSWRGCHGCWGCFFSHGSRGILRAVETQIASAAKKRPSPPLPADELPSHHKQLITQGSQLTNAKLQPLLLAAATCEHAGSGYCREGGWGRKPLTFKHLQPRGDVSAPSPSNTAMRASAPRGPHRPWWPPCSKGARGRSGATPGHSWPGQSHCQRMTGKANARLPACQAFLLHGFTSRYAQMQGV